MTKLDHKTVPVCDFKVLDEERGIIEAIVSVVGNVDSGKEIVMPGFFTESLKTRMPKGVWAHDWMQPVAKTLEADEWLAGDARLPTKLTDLGGYYIKGQFNLDTQRGREAYSDIKFGIVDEFSIGYSVQESVHNKDKGALELNKGTWFEWSPVLVGMNDQTQLLSLKDADSPAPYESLTKLLSVKGASVSDGPLDEHSETVVSALQEFAQLTTALDEQLQAFVKRSTDKQEYRIKEGRTISTATANKITTAKTQIDDAVPALAAVSSALSDLLEMASPKEKASPDEMCALRTQSLRLQSRALGVPI